MKRTVEVAILGQKFMVRSDSDDNYVNKIAGYVNDKVTEITSKAGNIPSLNIALLAAMNIADELLRSRNEKDRVFDGVQKKLEGMIELIDLQL